MPIQSEEVASPQGRAWLLLSSAAQPLAHAERKRRGANVSPFIIYLDSMNSMNITIRPERPSDENAITEVTRLAFEYHPFSHQTEHFIIRALRADHALLVSLVAEDAGRIVGHIALSPVSIGDGVAGWYGLGPISVEPGLQRRGIGRALMEKGLAELRKIEANGCVLVGDPAFYVRFGFANNPALVLEGVPQEFLLALSIGTSSAHGNVNFHPAFQAKG